MNRQRKRRGGAANARGFQMLTTDAFMIAVLVRVTNVRRSRNSRHPHWRKVRVAVPVARVSGNCTPLRLCAARRCCRKRAFAVAPRVHDADSVLRLPGTVHWQCQRGRLPACAVNRHGSACVAVIEEFAECGQRAHDYSCSVRAVSSLSQATLVDSRGCISGVAGSSMVLRRRFAEELTRDEMAQTGMRLSLTRPLRGVQDNAAHWHARGA